MKEKKWKEQLETACDPLQDQKSDILKRVDKRMPQWALETSGGSEKFDVVKVNL